MKLLNPHPVSTGYALIAMLTGIGLGVALGLIMCPLFH